MISGPSRVDRLHPNIQSVRNRRKTIKYIIKEGLYLTKGITEQGIKNLLKHGSLAESLECLEKRPDVNSYAIQFPQYFVKHHRGIRELCSIYRVTSTEKKKEIWPFAVIEAAKRYSDLKTELTYDENLPVYAWICKNVLLNFKRKYKQRQLFIHGPSNMGKSSLIDHLHKYLRVYTVPHEHFYDNYNDYDYDIAVIDEFTGQKPLSWMNSFLEGRPMSLRQKGRQYTKRKNLPVIILSNLSPEDCYRNGRINNPDGFQGLLNRLVVHELTTSLFSLIQNYLTSSKNGNTIKAIEESIKPDKSSNGTPTKENQEPDETIGDWLDYI